MDEESKLKHSKRIHQKKTHELYEKKNDIKHSHHSDNPRKTMKQRTIQERRESQEIND
jgi:hypothetical protein